MLRLTITGEIQGPTAINARFDMPVAAFSDFGHFQNRWTSTFTYKKKKRESVNTIFCYLWQHCSYRVLPL